MPRSVRLASVVPECAWSTRRRFWIMSHQVQLSPTASHPPTAVLDPARHATGPPACRRRCPYSPRPDMRRYCPTLENPICTALSHTRVVLAASLRLGFAHGKWPPVATCPRTLPPIWATTFSPVLPSVLHPKGMICSRPPTASCAASGDESHPAA